MPSQTNSSQTTPAQPNSPLRTLPVLPLRDVVFFPHVLMPLLIGRPGSLRAVEQAAGAGGEIVLVAQREGTIEEPRGRDLYREGVIARLVQVTRLPNGTMRVLLEGTERVRIVRYAGRAGAPLTATVREHPLGRDADPRITEAAARRTLNLFEEFVELQRRTPVEVVALAQGAPTAEQQAYVIAAHVPAPLPTRQRILESETLDDAFGALIVLMGGEIEVLRLERKLDDDTRGAMYQTQREFFLQEQLKVIHRELGQEDGDDVSELEEQLRVLVLPEQVRTRVQRELRRLRRVPPASPEHTVARTFLDWIQALPWDARSVESLDLERARAVLDEDHYGLEDVKERVLDFIAVAALVGHMTGPILCLVGPPGVGKTSLGRSIARALGRKFVRMSLGGVRDEAEIRGHRRTYIGALPGRVIQAMRRAEVVNPVILLDEVDKLGQDYRGDPAAALLEVLDPEQNVAFNDHYLEVDYDLSQVLFITTANSLAAIPEPLRDRMEIIRIAGYVDQEKLAIARRHLLPRQLAAHGLELEDVRLDTDVLSAILQGYTREAGVRELDRQLARLARKIARRAAEAGGDAASGDAAASTVHRVAITDLRELLGRAPYDMERDEDVDAVGVARGLAYTSAGGDTLDIEVSILPGRGRVSLTGTLGDVMKESATAALSYVRSRAAALGVPADVYRTRDVHIHVPDGATPKDGPSAGIAIATAVASALSGVPVRGDVAMTGEITLRGRVLPIGGLKEKSVAAHRNRVTDVIIPKGNAHEIEELPEEVRAAVRFHPVSSMDEVLAIALTGALPGAGAPRKRGAARAPGAAQPVVGAH